MIFRDKDPSLLTLLKQEGLKARGFDPGTIDNWDGEKTKAAYDAFIASMAVRKVFASTFAYEADIAAFRKCKNQGHSDNYCFAFGDNGIGAWGADTTSENDPMVALPPEDLEEKWGSVTGGRRKVVIVTRNGTSVRATVQDLMPSRANIENGAGIDLNPGAANALSIPAGEMAEVEWSWA